MLNAAAAGKRQWDEMSIANWDHMMEVILRVAFEAALHAVPSMCQGGYGKIINIDSIMAGLVELLRCARPADALGPSADVVSSGNLT